MKIIYPAVFHTEDDGTYWVEFPDLVGCNTCGDTIEDAIEASKEALTGYCLSVMERGIRLNAPTEITQINADGGIVKIIETDLRLQPVLNVRTA
ncbi:hypothetical protein FACS18949_18200 [Clostridia bacterium]|nr:hypothetical protein FACS189425_08200 [Clostridia bacterium]GHV37898.1 hypothetical protein FACS18949_18200 [Clostridia bacterium]